MKALEKAPKIKRGKEEKQEIYLYAIWIALL